MIEDDPNLNGLFGYPEVDRSPGWWMNYMPPEDIDRSLQAITTLRNGVPWEDRVRVRAADGEIVVLHMRSEPRREPGGRFSVLVRMRDVTEVARLEARLNDAHARLGLLEQGISILMWSTDEALRFTWSSGRALSSLGFEPDFLIGQSFYELFDTEDHEFPPIAAHHRALAGEKVEYEVEWSGVMWRAFVEPHHDEVGRISGVTGIGIDLSSLVRVAESERPVNGDSQGAFTADHGEGDALLRVGDLVIDRRAFEVRRGDSHISVSVSEFKLLVEFALHLGEALSPEFLAEQVWGHSFLGGSASVKMAISRLRGKIEADPGNPKLLTTVRGVGYRLAPRD